MKIKKNKHTMIIISVLAILIIIIVIFCSATKVINSETISIEETKSNMGITTEDEISTWDTSKLSEIIVDTSMVDSETGEKITMYVPIPSGYTASKATSEDEVVEGLVIYEGTDEVNDTNVAEAKKTRNQYVWIPADSEDVYWTDSDGKIYGTSLSFSATNITVSKSKLEPVISETEAQYYQEYYLDTAHSNINTELGLEGDMEESFNSMVQSIKIYGGYYIGRYEVGDETALTRDANSGTSANAVEMQGKYTYNYINWFEAYDLCKTLSRR